MRPRPATRHGDRPRQEAFTVSCRFRAAPPARQGDHPCVPYIALVVLVAVFVVSAVTASAQSRGVMTDLAKDIADVETKVVGLANAMPEAACATGGR